MIIQASLFIKLWPHFRQILQKWTFHVLKDYAGYSRVCSLITREKYYNNARNAMLIGENALFQLCGFLSKLFSCYFPTVITFISFSICFFMEFLFLFLTPSATVLIFFLAVTISFLIQYIHVHFSLLINSPIH